MPSSGPTKAYSAEVGSPDRDRLAHGACTLTAITTAARSTKHVKSVLEISAASLRVSVPPGRRPSTLLTGAGAARGQGALINPVTNVGEFVRPFPVA
jgi:hypothetical protein